MMLNYPEIQISSLQNIPSTWFMSLFSMYAVTALIRWFIEHGDLSIIDAVCNQIQFVIDALLNKIRIIQNFINNGFVHNNIPLDLVGTHVYLTEYIRIIMRILRFFGIFINILEELGMLNENLETLYLDFHDNISTLVTLYYRIEDQMGIVSDQSHFNPLNR